MLAPGLPSQSTNVALQRPPLLGVRVEGCFPAETGTAHHHVEGQNWKGPRGHLTPNFILEGTETREELSSPGSCSTC